MAAPYKVIVDPSLKDGYRLRGDNRRLLSCREPRVVLCGPSDSGKTVACCVKLHLNCLRYAGGQHSIVRKTFASMPGSVCQTFQKVIAGAGVQSLGADAPRLFTYPNGSKVWVGGLDNPEKTLSSERDTIYVNQAEELALSDWETLSTRCTGRAAVVRTPQLFGDCNPSGSQHWIRKEAEGGKLTLLNARHEDNPTLYGDDANVLPEGERRLKALADLTGVRRKRLFLGVWATAEGAVYDNFDPAVHVLHRDWREAKRWYLAVDEGYTNPAVILLVGVDSDGRWHVFREFYQPGVLQETVVKMAKQWFLSANRTAGAPSSEPERRCDVAAVDEAAAGLIADMKAVGVNAVGGKGRVVDGIQRIQNRLAPAGDGRPRLTFDPSCRNCVNEFESYVWQSDKPKDTPVKEHDHCSDALRYLGDVLGESLGFTSAGWVRTAETPDVFVAERLEL